MAREKLFRVQHPDDGRGPFRPGFSKIWVDVSDLPRPPIPDDDPGLPELYPGTEKTRRSQARKKRRA